jgi:hypothetical protein
MDAGGRSLKPMRVPSPPGNDKPKAEEAKQPS